MAKVRIGIATAFELENELVGIGTDNPTNTLQALGTVQSSNVKSTGVSTLTTYQGFADSKLNLYNSLGAKHGTISGEIIIEDNITVSTGTTYTSGVDNLTVKDNFTLPGIIEDNPSAVTTRFNETLASLEFYNGSEWKAVNSIIDIGNRCRGICCGGETNKSEINYFNIQSKGNALMFGELTAGRGNPGAVSNGTRGIIAGGEPATDLIQYFTIASQGNATDFDGNLTANRRFPTGCSSSTRGLYMGGSEPTRVNKIDYIEMASTGVDAADFGDLTEAKDSGGGGAWSNGTRGGVIGGYPDTTTIEVLTIASKGNATKFGTALGKGHNIASTSNHVRAIGGGGNPSGNYNTIQYITMASDGNAAYFGDLSFGRASADGCSSGTRSVFSGGTQSPGGVVNNMDYVEIATTGNATDFGDLTYKPKCAAALSDCHGGLGGF